MIGNSQTLTATLYNYSSATVNLGPISFTGANGGDFTDAGTGTCGASIGPGSSTTPATCTIKVLYQPTGVGVETATFNVANSSASNPATQPLKTLATVPDTVPGSITFGSIAATSSQVKSIAVTNLASTGSLTTSISSSLADFSDNGTGSCNGTLPPMSNCTYDIKFVPTQGGKRTGTISVSIAQDPYSPRKVTAQGIGLWPSVAPSSHNFGAVTVGAPSNTTFTVSNNQPQTINLSYSFGGSYPGDYAVTGGSCGSTLAGNMSCTYQVTFTPGATGTRYATLIVTDTGTGDPTSPHTANLYGSGK